MTAPELWLVLAVTIAAAIISAVVILIIRPLLLKHALAKPNARSSHRVPTPQGAGIAVIAATLVAAGLVLAYFGGAGSNFPVALFGATLVIAALGFADDIRPVPVLPRLLLQAIAVGAVVLAGSCDVRITPFLPVWIERGLLVLAGLWFVNLVNFMDGLDWMTAAEVVPVTAALALLGLAGQLPPAAAIVAAALCGAMIGFAPFNRPVATIFLGDVGSLPIGLMLFWLLLRLAANGHLAAAIELPLYYVADATVTLVLRLVRRENLLRAHRSHFYQLATDRGYSVAEVVTTVFITNVALAFLAIMTIGRTSLEAHAVALALAAMAVLVALVRFARGKP
jgi:UDP-N-acetylmuramyl pentapeptide phosphotransferase/UDP-N-acetylglucosamine-1-phosphate transferase